MNKKNIVWGLIFIMAAILVVCGAFGDFGKSGKFNYNGAVDSNYHFKCSSFSIPGHSFFRWQ